MIHQKIDVNDFDGKMEFCGVIGQWEKWNGKETVYLRGNYLGITYVMEWMELFRMNVYISQIQGLLTGCACSFQNCGEVLEGEKDGKSLPAEWHFQTEVLRLAKLVQVSLNDAVVLFHTASTVVAV